MSSRLQGAKIFPETMGEKYGHDFIKSGSDRNLTSREGQ